MNSQRLSLWVILGFGITGLLIGFVTGMSHTPVVGQLLPLLFGLFSGGAGFVAVKHVEQSRAIGVSLTVFSAMALLGITAGIAGRDAISWRQVLKGHQSISLSSGDAAKDPLRYARLLAIKTKLQILYVSSNDVEEFMQKLSTVPDEKLGQVETAISTLFKDTAGNKPMLLIPGGGLAIEPNIGTHATASLRPEGNASGD